MKKYFDPDEVRRAVMYKGLFECRIIYGSRKMLSGYFDNADDLISALGKLSLEGAAVCVTLQDIHEGCRARVQWGRFLSGDFPTTSDRDVVRYKYIPVDLDPVRPAGISSTAEELQAAEELAGQIISYMKIQGYTQYIRALSGNGYHLLYPIDCPNTKESSDYVRDTLTNLDELFSNDRCHIDTTLYNAARILKLYGTLAQKGRSTPDRPHRMARILEVSL